ncbi:MAG: PP2C family protein-serine/threonine phosphatase [Aureispira sp.]
MGGEIGVKWYKTNKAKYTLAGALFGVCFPVIAVSIDIIRLGLSFTWINIIWVQLEFPIHLIIDTAPLFLGLFALIGGVRQDKIEILNAILQDKIDVQAVELKTSTDDLEASKLLRLKMASELNIARDIQLSMLPLDFPAFPDRKDINIHAALVPAKAVGGDFYDFFFLDEDHLCFVVGDVSGKGVPAALVMAECKTLIKSHTPLQKSTADVITQVNYEMALHNQNYMFVTVFMAILNTKTGTLNYTNAGHNPAIVRKQDGSIRKLKELHGPVVAAVENFDYKETSLQLERGDVIFAYTDGVTEAHNLQNELFSYDKLEEMLKVTFVDASTTVDTVIKAVKDFEAGRESFDDITAFCLEYVGE